MVDDTPEVVGIVYDPLLAPDQTTMRRAGSDYFRANPDVGADPVRAAATLELALGARERGYSAPEAFEVAGREARRLPATQPDSAAARSRVVAEEIAAGRPGTRGAP